MAIPALTSEKFQRYTRKAAGILGALGGAWFMLHTGVLLVTGCRDNLGAADVIVVLGNTVEPNGEPSPRLRSRLERALSAYQAGLAPLVIVSGGKGQEGYEEALVMQAYLYERGIPPTSVLADVSGYDTYRTARYAAAVMRERNLTRAIIVTQYYHVLRARLALKAFGVPEVYHACARLDPELREPYSLLREFAAFYYYLFRRYEPESATA